ncbi:MAG: HAD family hydrolase [Candidatus Gribaldobacteria bacterium]|nr:HAD family hydrolase [Candidatus Gribaldobacteria bacterium]
MIKALILDVDGVLVGSREGFNFPEPHPEVIKALKAIRQKGIFVSLCTAKSHFSIESIILDAHLDNVHITEAGAMIFDPINQQVAKRVDLNHQQALEILKNLLEAGIYTEIYNGLNYIVQKGNIIEGILGKHLVIVKKDPIIVDSLLEVAKDFEITKIMPVVENEEQKEIVNRIFNSVDRDLNLGWTMHPTAFAKVQFGIITAKGVSKRQGALDISQSTGVSLEDTLGVGDTLMDWDFIELCGYGSAMGNASDELKQKVLTKGQDFAYIGSSVDENGILEILKHFGFI